MFSQSQGKTMNLIHAFLSEIIATTLQVCGFSGTLMNECVPAIDMAQLADSTEILASFLALLGQLMRKYPRLLAATSYPMSSLFYCGIVGLTRPESPTFKSAVQYLVHFITYSRDNADLVAIVQNQGQLLVNQLLRCIGTFNTAIVLAISR